MKTPPMYSRFRMSGVAILPATLGLVLASGGSFAQENASVDIQTRTLDSMTVTGSRLPGTDLTASSPVTIIDRLAIEATGLGSVGEVLRTLPVASAATSDTAGRGNNGSANVSLRGLDAVNTLVLLNGRRLISNNAQGTVDLNSIPFEAVERVEVLQDGASAVYGSDAIAGVVNILTRKGGDGITLAGSYGLSSRGDLPERKLSMSTGKTFDRGNVLFVAGYRNRGGNVIADRPVSRDPDWRSRGGRNFRDWAPITGTAFSGIDDSGNYYIIREGVNQVMSLADMRPAIFPGTNTPLDSGNDGINYWEYESSTVDLEQKNLWLSGDYEFTSNLSGFVESSWVSRDSFGFYAPVYIDGTITVSAGNIYNPFGRDLQIFRTFVEQPHDQVRMQDIKSSVFRLTGGLKGYIGESLWSWDVSASYQSLRQNNHRGRGIDENKLSLAVGDTALCRLTPGCVPVNVFAAVGGVTQEMLDWFTYIPFQNIRTKLQSFTANTAGAVMELPAGDVNLALGLEYREESYHSISHDDPNIDTDFPLYAPATRKVSEAYVEVGIPLLADLTGAYSLDLEAAARYSHYNTFGNTTNPKVSLKYKPVEDLMLRYSWGEGFRTPNFTESSTQVTRGYQPQIDPCAGDNYLMYPGCNGVRAPIVTGNWTIRGGNENLKPETSQTRTIGLVWTPLDELSFTLDYFKIKKQDIIDIANVDYIIEQNALGFQFLDRVVRRSDGAIDFVLATMDNLMEQSINGYDFGFNYVLRRDCCGSFNFNVQATLIDSYMSSPSADAAPIEIVGTYTTTLGTIPRWKSSGSLMWSHVDWTLNYGFRYVGSVENQASIQREGRYLRADDYLQHDVSASRYFPRFNTRATLGVQNVFDEMPPWLEGNYFNGFDAMSFDSRGRYFYLNVEYTF